MAAAALIAALLLLQSPPAGYRVGPGAVSPEPAPYRTGPTEPQVRTPAERASTEEPGYAVSPEALPVGPRLRPTGVTIDAYDRSVEGYRAPEDRAYEAVILGGAAAAQGRQGSLDGAWELGGQTGGALYRLQLAQAGEGEPVEGAWRKATPANAARVSGFVLAAPEAGRLTLRFFEPAGTRPIVVTLQPAVDGSWRGEMVREGETSAVVMRRR